ncbi:UTRA domain-containing protein [Rubrobacter marinus]|uniref:UTRA domain-containing protein n=1 Tax=Rubrobacter marinus TaxID=2653852 RepID=A0A6G8PWA0_9ACTN|nr:GntR family transcriptional regulator [Rubrobacter marinus]QIN78484.1 UTRA domain-containing protein [Rubrobacter marinus]
MEPKRSKEASGGSGRPRGRVFAFPPSPQRGVALYLQVADQLRGRIDSGELAPGDQLPPEVELADGFGVSRHTVRQALRHLRDRGYLASRQGKGSTVRDRKRGLQVNPVIGSINDLVQFASETVLKPVSVVEEPAGAEVAELLDLEPERSRVVRINGLRCERDGAVFGYTKVYVPVELAKGLRAETIHSVPIYAQVERNSGIEVAGVEQRISAGGADEELVEHLGLEPHEPVLKISRLYYATGGAPVEFAESFHPPSAFEYVIHLRKGF